MLLRDLRLDFLVRDNATFFHIDKQHAARLQTPLLDDLLFVDWQNTCFGSQNDKIIIRHKITGGTQTIAIKRSANLAAIGKGDSGRTIPRLHERCMIFVERTAFI